jgi:hypothetical protein
VTPFVDPIGQVAEIAPAVIALGIPVPGDFQQRAVPLPGAFCVIWGGQEYQGEAPCLAVIAVDLYQAEFIAVKIQRPPSLS